MPDQFLSSLDIADVVAPVAAGVLALFVLMLVIGGLRRLATAAKMAGTSRRERRDPVSVGDLPTCTGPLLNLSERRVFHEIEALLPQNGGGHRLFAQVALGEVVKVQSGVADAAVRQATLNRINAKRLDFLIVDRDWNPTLALEYHGSGHFRGDAEFRDAVKREACRSAGLPLIEIAGAGLSPAQRDEIRRRLGHPAPVAADRHGAGDPRPNPSRPAA